MLSWTAICFGCFLVGVLGANSSPSNGLFYQFKYYPWTSIQTDSLRRLPELDGRDLKLEEKRETVFMPNAKEYEAQIQARRRFGFGLGKRSGIRSFAEDYGLFDNRDQQDLLKT
ncbi:hypothetical protein RvY_07612 [Ramazzottius varieornatus]|uniref:Uncharacterized protein n=1 Tax=Ramazzottius varieornatus TaxID=947166 RepID=A0A1D1VB78_RAMVA|nr:hypothetical protein RvY_07612 [Ramazzottius varieornatus]